MFTSAFRRVDWRVTTSILIWILGMISTPVVGWIMGDNAFYVMVNVGVILQASSVFIVFISANRLKVFLLNVLPIIPAAWLIEFIGSHTGFPFGSYTYTDSLNPQIGNVPLLIPLAWLMMLPPSWAVAEWILKKSKKNFSPILVRVFRALLAALAFSMWDLFLDPQMVHWGLWRWASPGIYFGIPLTNYLGWFLASFLLSFLFVPINTPVTPLVIIYTVMWFLEFFGLVFFWGMPGPAIFGFVGMGLMLVWVVARTERYA
jgi:lycopene beta-cyclase